MAMPQHTHIDDIVDGAHAPEIRDLLSRFNGCAVESLGAPYSVFNLAVLDAFRDNLAIFSPDVSGDFSCLHFGRDIVRMAGLDLAGRRITDLPSDQAASTLHNCRRAIDLGRAIYSRQRSGQLGRASVWEGLFMPAFSEAGERHVLLFTLPVVLREQLLSAILDSSHDGIFAFSAIHNARNQIEDALITTANRRGAEIFGRQLNDIINRSALQSLPILTENNLWERCLSVMQTGLADRSETNYTIDGTEFWFQIALNALESGLVMTLTDVTDLKLANLALQSRAATLAIEIGRERASIQALSSEISVRDRRELELRRMADTDSLTGLLNRRTFEAQANLVIRAAHRAGETMSILLIDLDHFKSVNDTYGHAAGDVVLQVAAEKLASSVRRGSDLVGRLGGEEFAICLSRIDPAHARRICESLRAALAGTPALTPCGKMVRFSASFGVATLAPGETLSHVLARADRALYAAKHAGRNCVIVDEDQISLPHSA